MLKDLPEVTFYTRERDDTIDSPNPFKWVLKTTSDYFANKRVAVFSLPGAFTPTCSTMQVPGYENAYDEIRSLDIDEVYVISVNDAFVMRKWMIDQEVDSLIAIPDGNGEFTEKVGMLVDKSNLGFGKRSWRYSMIVNDMRIEKMFVEPGKRDLCDEDPYSVTNPETMLDYLRSI